LLGETLQLFLLLPPLVHKTRDEDNIEEQKESATNSRANDDNHGELALLLKGLKVQLLTRASWWTTFKLKKERKL
jgi:hypothetical protein